ncbi:nlp-53 [Pristionchus pacificus]|uniref:Uncharacterized protein n=1 Tax=Pristionchus pacificus TaxID=54126 RepID=A0A2A6BEY3_PRIPA|nr:nlp-53 [Pristionchus pacificus]|eukprot:PDM64437.1 hypothetical protein PRIPAC_52693 [Pristionchus pacificus]
MSSCLAPVPMMRVALATLLSCLLLLPTPADTRPTTAADYVRMLIEQSRDQNDGFPLLQLIGSESAAPVPIEYSNPYSKRSNEGMRRASRSNEADRINVNSLGSMPMFRFG